MEESARLIRRMSFEPWSLLAGWTVVNLFGWAAGLAVGVGLTLVATRISWLNEDRFFSYAILTSLGATVGVAQWLVIQRYLPNAVRWIVATILGYLLFIVIFTGGNLIGFGGTGLWDDVLLLTLMGVAIGAPQGWLLRQHYHRAGLWVPVNALGFVVFLLLIIHPSISLGNLILQGAIIGAVGAMASGVLLIWIVRRPLAPASP